MFFLLSFSKKSPHAKRFSLREAAILAASPKKNLSLCPRSISPFWAMEPSRCLCGGAFQNHSKTHGDFSKAKLCLNKWSCAYTSQALLRPKRGPVFQEWSFFYFYHFQKFFMSFFSFKNYFRHLFESIFDRYPQTAFQITTQIVKNC